MHQLPKEKLMACAIRAIRNASVNNKIVEMHYGKGCALVYPDDKPNMVALALKYSDLVNSVKAVKMTPQTA